MAELQYFLEPNPVRPGKYRAVLVRGKKLSLKDFLRHVEKTSSTIGVPDVLGTIKVMADWIELHAANGQGVDFGLLGHTRLGLSGSFDSRDARLEEKDYKLTIGWQLSSQLRKAVRAAGYKAELVRISKPTRPPWIRNVVDLITKQYDVYTPAGLLELRGQYLKFDAEMKDEGVFFRTAEGQPEVRAEHYGVNRRQTIQLLVPQELTGTQQVLIRRRNKPGEFPQQDIFSKKLSQGDR